DGISVDGSNITEVERKRSKRQNSGSFVQTTEQEYEDEDQTDTSAAFVTEAVPEHRTSVDPPSQSEASKSQLTSPNAQPEPLPTAAATRKPLITHPEPEPKSVLKPSGKPEPEPIGNSQPKAEPEPSLKPAAEPEPNPHGHHHHGHDDNGLHPMDCADMIVGSAIGQLSRIQDFYTISRATPLLDEVYGGRQSLTAAIGSEVKGQTTTEITIDRLLGRP
uniref:Uncharacterized protein n=1 Tax=Romanomermis culicivorax TaxID=13658 RepID=A0A915HZK7_ROMCU